MYALSCCFLPCCLSYFTYSYIHFPQFSSFHPRSTADMEDDRSKTFSRNHSSLCVAVLRIPSWLLLYLPTDFRRAEFVVRGVWMTDWENSFSPVVYSEMLFLSCFIISSKQVHSTVQPGSLSHFFSRLEHGLVSIHSYENFEGEKMGAYMYISMLQYVWWCLYCSINIRR